MGQHIIARQKITFTSIVLQKVLADNKIAKHDGPYFIYEYIHQ